LIDDNSEMFLNEGTDKESEATLLNKTCIETQLHLADAATIEEYQNKLKDDPEHACVSCHRLFGRDGITKFQYV